MVDGKCIVLPSINAVSVNANARYSPFFQQKPDCIKTKPREALAAGGILAQEFPRVSPFILPASIQQQNTTRGDRAELPLPLQQVITSQDIIRTGRRSVPHINGDSRRNKGLGRVSVNAYDSG